MEVTLPQVKNYLWLNEDDTRLQLILNQVNLEVISTIWDYSFWTKEINTKIRENNTYWLEHINATELLEINWETELDYQINFDWTVQVLQDVPDNDFKTWNIKYKAWFTEAPADIIWAVAEYCWAIYAKDLWRDVSSEKLWPRAVSYTWIADAKKNFKKKLRKYIPLHLRLW